jgi:PAS domain S-box-containing protein
VALSWKQDPAQSQPVADLAFWELIRVNVLPLALPLLVLAMAARIALARLPAAILAVMLSIMCYGIRTFVVQCRQARATMRLTQSEHRFESLFQRHPQPMWVFDPKTLRFLEVNLAAIEKYGYSRDEFLKMTVLDIRPEEDASQFMSLSLDFDQPLRLRSWRHKVRSGRVIHVEVTAQKVRFTERSALLVIALDITQKMELEEQLRQSQKMEAVGTLAGGVAHDFNNLLTVIKGYSSLLISSMPTDSDERRQLLEIDRAAERAAGLTRQLLAFSRRQILKAELLDINTLIVNVSRMLERLIGEDIRVITDLEPGLGMVKADPAQLDQVLLNLAVNARDAMPQGGELRFVTNNVPAREIGDREHLHLEAEQYVMLRVSDTGCGMDADLKAHIFEPFFTTKSPGKGTGLGLSTVYGIVKQSGGHIRVDSAPGKGTSFTIYIPLVPGKAAAPTSSEMPDAGLRPARRTVVLVEDETSLRRYAARVLREHGYRVFDAADAEDAMQIFRKADETIDLLLTDVVMPGMNGHVLANEVRLLWPATKVLYMTGYTEETVLRNGVKDSEIELLQKPFPPAVLLRRVAAVLEEEATSASS